MHSIVDIQEGVNGLLRDEEKFVSFVKSIYSKAERGLRYRGKKRTSDKLGSVIFFASSFPWRKISSKLKGKAFSLTFLKGNRSNPV